MDNLEFILLTFATNKGIEWIAELKNIRCMSICALKILLTKVG